MEVPKKISEHISKNWLRYDHLKWRGKIEKWRKRPFLAFFSFTTSLQMVISQPFFGNMAWNFFWNLQTSYISKIEKKIWVPWPKNIVFRSMNSKNCFFLAIFGFCGQIFLWSHLRRATNFYMMVVAFIRNFHFKFEVIPFIFVVTMKKKLHFFRFRGPFWAFLGTPQ